MCALTAAATAAPMTVYDDALQNSWQDWSWGTHSLSATTPVHGGTRSISFEPDAWNGLSFHLNGGVTVASYDALDFWVHGGTTGGQNIYVIFENAGTTLINLPLTTWLPGGPVAGAWRSVHIDFDSLPALNGQTIDRITWQDGTGGNQATTYFDDISVHDRPVQTGPVTITVDPNLNRRAINPWIYGVSSNDGSSPSTLKFPLVRWGGNATTRYNYMADVSNRAMDWFFLNIANPDPGTLPDNSAADVFIDQTRAKQGEVLMTLPIIGWTPKDRQSRWGMSQSKYGAQTNDECRATGNPPWCHPDAGNGILSINNQPILNADPTDTSMAITPTWDTAWMAHIAGRVGNGSQGGVKLWALDNEPMLWSSTHQDVHPTKLDYTEIWSRTQSYAPAIKAQDAAAQIMGPVCWGWCDYFYSDHDGCGPGTDYTTYGPFLEWYLGKAQTYQTQNGTRILDYLDIHYYPQANNVALSNDESAGTSALRLRTVKSLYDPAYTDESWIGTQVKLIPRMKDIIARKYPGTKLAITEYNWGNDDGLSSALAQVDVLGIFGREGVDIGARWVMPDAGTRVDDAFKLFLDYDGAGARAAGDSVSAASSNVDAITSYAIRSSGQTLWIYLVNHDTAQRDAAVTVATGLTGSGHIYGFDGTYRYHDYGAFVPGGTGFTLTMPGRSARLCVVTMNCTTPPRVTNLALAKSGANLRFTWTDTTNTTDYVVFEDTAPGGTFATQTGVATSGTTGLTIAMPAGNKYYRVAARNGCGIGPLN